MLNYALHMSYSSYIFSVTVKKICELLHMLSLFNNLGLLVIIDRKNISRCPIRTNETSFLIKSEIM